MDAGELLHVGPDLEVTTSVALGEPPARPLTLADLSPHAAASQHPAAGRPAHR
jgi:glutamine amidotransferase